MRGKVVQRLCPALFSARHRLHLPAPPTCIYMMDVMQQGNHAQRIATYISLLN